MLKVISYLVLIVWRKVFIFSPTCIFIKLSLRDSKVSKSLHLVNVEFLKKRVGVLLYLGESSNYFAGGTVTNKVCFSFSVLEESEGHKLVVGVTKACTNV